METKLHGASKQAQHTVIRKWSTVFIMRAIQIYTYFILYKFMYTLHDIWTWLCTGHLYTLTVRSTFGWRPCCYSPVPPDSPQLLKLSFRPSEWFGGHGHGVRLVALTYMHTSSDGRTDGRVGSVGDLRVTGRPHWLLAWDRRRLLCKDLEQILWEQ